MESKILYSVEGIRINDSWYAFDGAVYHAFFLQYPQSGDPEGFWSEQSIGHCVSDDLINWKYLGIVLRPEPNTWDNKGLATGSVVKHSNGFWYMIYTGNSTADSGGFGLAVSEDLYSWKRCGDKPIISRDDLQDAYYMDNKYTVRMLADPYIYPERIGDYYYIFINSVVKELPVNKRSCQLVLKTKNLYNYEVHNIALLPNRYDRTETAQVWEHAGNWYMYFGGVMTEVNGISTSSTVNTVYISDKFDGPYVKLFNNELIMPDKQWYYILKVIKDRDGNDKILTNIIPVGVTGLYSIKYEKDGSFIVHL